MKIERTEISGLWILESPIHDDNRGSFKEWFKSDSSTEVLGDNFNIKQANTSLSHKGAIRGVHYSIAQAKQNKIVSCSHGSITDIVTDLRLNSPTFGKSKYVYLSGKDGKSLVISAGLGHSFVALEDFTVVTYLLTSEYDPKLEFGVNPFDSDLELELDSENVIVSEKDRNAPSLKELIERGLLPKN